MKKVLSSGKGISIGNGTPPKGKPNIGPKSTMASRSGGPVKPTGAKHTMQIQNNPLVAAKSTKKGLSVPGRGSGAGLPKARGAMPKF